MYEARKGRKESEAKGEGREKEGRKERNEKEKGREGDERREVDRRGISK